MFDHVSVTVGDFEASRRFYKAALTPLGYGEYNRSDNAGAEATGFGNGEVDFWIGEGGPVTGKLHVAFRAPDRAAVDEFYAAALAAGGRDNGPPGLRARYHPHYYGAFVLDPDGHNVEAVCHTPEARGSEPENPTER